ncbi:hypothetical protein JCGZ_02980 [Jatropha curcas]|uniref:Uncharacterized protein n=1 Tax=Jatropha curcas TaxID=180498 RepID=A0A067LCP6_JATCU|nr:hypothetical protein JCGZ_02980 [Jatropha curcas]
MQRRPHPSPFLLFVFPTTEDQRLRHHSLPPSPPHRASPASPFLSSFVSGERSVAGGAVTLPRSGSRVAAFSSIFRRHQPIAGQSPRLQHPSNAVAPPLVTGSSRFSEKEEGQRATLHFADR